MRCNTLSSNLVGSLRKRSLRVARCRERGEQRGHLVMRPPEQKRRGPRPLQSHSGCFLPAAEEWMDAAKSGLHAIDASMACTKSKHAVIVDVR